MLNMTLPLSFVSAKDAIATTGSMLFNLGTTVFLR